VAERAGGLEVLHELVDVLDGAADHVDGEDAAGPAIYFRTDGDETHVVGQRRLEAVEQLRPGERPA